MSAVTLTSARPLTIKGVRLPRDAALKEEQAEEYAPGGYRQIHVGDSINNGRYRVVRKLGFGHFSTVWLVQDERCVLLSSLSASNCIDHRRGDVPRSCVRLAARRTWCSSDADSDGQLTPVCFNSPRLAQEWKWGCFEALIFRATHGFCLIDDGKFRLETKS